MSKVPKLKDKAKYIGIEIEAFSKNNPFDLFKKHEVKNYATIGTDTSIHPYYTNDHSFELRVLSKQTQLKLVLEVVGDFLKKVGAETNQTCGLHVHLDMRHQDVSKCYSNLIRKQDQIYKSIPESRQSNDYCLYVEKNKAETIIKSLKSFSSKINYDYVEELILNVLNKNNLKYHGYDLEDFIDSILDENDLTSSHYVTDKYDGISADPIVQGDYQTIEVRCHEGTVDTKAIYNWCRYLIDVCYNNKLTKASDEYIKQRIKAAS